MGRITSTTGLVSGINTGAIIDQLIQLESRPVTLLQSQIKTATSQKSAYTDLSTQIDALKAVGDALSLPSAFQAATPTSSDPNTLTATAANGAALGSYQFQVARLVTTQQSITNGFADTTSAPVGAGNLTIELGGGEASSETTLQALNGGAGVQRGQFRITDRGGNSTVIDTSNAITLDDVVKKINTSLNISVKATVTDQGLQLTDLTGKTNNDLIVQDLGGGSAASSLGIAGDVAGNVLTGTNINYLSGSTSLAQLNDGRGLRTATAGQDDFTASLADGTVVHLQLNGAKTVGDVLTKINTAGNGKLTASIGPGGTGLKLTDTTTGGGTLTLAAANGSKALGDLGLTTPASGNTVTGKPVIAGLDSVLLSSLKGGSGLAAGTIFVTDRAGGTGQIDLSGATSLRDVIDDINNNSSGIKVRASLNQAGTGLQVTDTSGGSGNLVIGDVNSTTAGALGIAGTFDATKTAVTGVNLQRQYISENTALSDYKGGHGVNLGQFQITTASGVSSTIDLGSGTYNTVGDVLQAINSKAIGVTASINANGNGILLTDTTTGAQKLTVKDLGGTAAADLNIAGTATTNTIDGALQKTIAISSADTLATVQTKINTAGFGVVANIVNDGSGLSPYRLSLTATNTGRVGRVVLDGGTTNLGPRNLVEAQDAAVFLGGGDGSNQPLLITSNKNQLANVIKGVTINLVGASSNPVTLNVSQDTSGLVKQLQAFTDTFNAVTTKIGDDTKFDTTTNTGGLLLGDSTVQSIQDQMYSVFNTVVKGAGKYKMLADIGVTIGDKATIQFDSNKFQAALAEDPQSVSSLFTQVTTGLGTVISKTMTGLTDPVSGLITTETKTLDDKVKGFNDRITQLNDIIANKRTQLETQFANMETILSNLQSQQQALSSLTGVSAARTSSAPTTSSSSSSSGA